MLNKDADPLALDGRSVSISPHDHAAIKLTIDVRRAEREMNDDSLEPLPDLEEKHRRSEESGMRRVVVCHMDVE